MAIESHSAAEIPKDDLAPLSQRDYAYTRARGSYGRLGRVNLLGSSDKTTEFCVKRLYQSPKMSDEEFEKFKAEVGISIITEKDKSEVVHIRSLAKRLNLTPDELREAEAQGKERLQALIDTQLKIMSSETVKKAFLEVKRHREDESSTGVDFAAGPNGSPISVYYDEKDELHLTYLDRSQLIASGDFGDVFLIRELAHPIMRAVKVPAVHDGSHQREYEVLKAAHGNGIMEGISDAPYPVIYMTEEAMIQGNISRFEEGTDAVRWLLSKPPLEERQAVAQGLFEGRERLRKARIVNPDLKAANVLLRKVQVKDRQRHKKIIMQPIIGDWGAGMVFDPKIKLNIPPWPKHDFALGTLKYNMESIWSASKSLRYYYDAAAAYIDTDTMAKCREQLEIISNVQMDFELGITMLEILIGNHPNNVLNISGHDFLNYTAEQRKVLMDYLSGQHPKNSARLASDAMITIINQLITPPVEKIRNAESVIMDAAYSSPGLPSESPSFEPDDLPP